MWKQLCKWGFIFSLLIGFNTTTYATEINPDKLPSFIVFADIHFNPYDGCQNKFPCPMVVQLVHADYKDWDAIFSKYNASALNTYGTNTNYPLFTSSLNAIQKQAQAHSVGFALFLGDSLAHRYQINYRKYSGDKTKTGYQAFVKKTMQYFALSVHNKLSNIPVYFVVGNNDSYTDDYGSVPSGPFFHDLTTTWVSLVNDKNNQNNFATEFPTAGYYEVNFPNSENKLIVLNTVLFATQVRGSENHEAAQAELTWLAARLKFAEENNQKVLLAFHIPVGINVYPIIKDPFHFIHSFWRKDVTQQFLTFLDQYPVVSGILTGHLHMDGFVLLGKNHNIINTFVPAISPIFSNNPAFKIYFYDPKTLALKNYLTFFLPLKNYNTQQWEFEYSFNKVYQPKCVDCNLAIGAEKLPEEGQLANAYLSFLPVSSQQTKIAGPKWLPYYWCSIWNTAPMTYKSCMGKYM